MFVNKAIIEIEGQVWQNFKDDERIGFLSGLSGVAFFYDAIYEVYKNPEYEIKLIEIIEKINSLVSENGQIESFCSGLAGYGWMLLKLKNKSIDIDNAYFQALDEALEETLLENSKENFFDFLHGATGIAIYFIERYKQSKSDYVENIIKEFSEILISKMSFEIEIVFEEFSIMFNDRCYSFGLAHGVSGYINFLIYLKNTVGDFISNIDNSLNNAVTFLMKYRKYDEITMQQFPYKYNIETNESVSARLAWCIGDLGIGNALYNAALFLNDSKLQEEAISIINATQKITLEISRVKDFAICHGTAGIILQYYLAEVKFKQNNLKIISYWMEILENQTKNYTEFNSFDIDKYINEKNVLNGSSGLGLVLLTINKKISSDWLISLNLH
jgi:lantibiotic biosynthesis protein